MNRKVAEWNEELIKLASTSFSHMQTLRLHSWLCSLFHLVPQPHQGFSAIIYNPLEDIIRSQPCLDWPSDLKNKLFTLPSRLGGLGIANPASSLSKEFPASISTPPEPPFCGSTIRRKTRNSHLPAKLSFKSTDRD